MENIILFGFMGTGKTAVGKLLAEKLNMEYVDMDDIIEEKEKISITKIFATKGEPYFRKVESEVAKEIAEKQGLVVATGGGVVLNPENIRMLEKTGVGICLSASAETIYNRVKDETHRPLLKVKDPLKKIVDLLNFRAPYYAKVSHQIDTTSMSVPEIVKRIIKIVGKSK